MARAKKTDSIKESTTRKRTSKSKISADDILDANIEERIINEDIDEDVDFDNEITDADLEMAENIDLDFEEDLENGLDFENMSLEDNLDLSNNNYTRVYKTSNKSETIRQRFVGICERYQSDDPKVKKDALEDAINELKSFVHYVIRKKYATYTKHYEDLVQEGIMGIIKGMEKYNPEKSLPTTFFNLYIIHEMSKFIDTEVNKTTSHYSSNLTKINRVIDRLEQAGKKWTPTDIAIETNLNMETVIQCLNIKEYKNEMYYETDEILEANITEKTPSPEQLYIENEKNQTLYDAIDTLLPEEKQVLYYRYGLNESKVISYKEIAKEMGISIEKVRKYRHDAIRKLKHKSGMRNVFRDYINTEEENILNEASISLVQEDLANAIMNEIEEIDFDFDNL